MSIEVANLLARIQMVADGVPEVLRATEEVRKKLEGMGEAGSAAAARLSENQIKAAVALGRYEAAVKKAAEAQDKLTAAEAKTGVDAETASRKVAELTAEIDKLNAAAAGGTRSSADIASLKGLEAERKAFLAVSKAASEVETTKHRVLSAGERLVVANRRLGEETVQTGKRFRILTTEITGLVSALRTGELGSTLLARTLIRLGDAAKSAGSIGAAGLSLIGIAVAGVLAGFAALKAGAAAAGDFVKISHLPELSDELAEIADRANVAGDSLRGMSLDATNVFRSLDIRNADAATDAVARLAEQLRFLTPDADFAKTFDTLLKGVTSGNLESVARTFGLSAAALKEALGETEGLSDAEITTRSINALMAETPKHAERIQEAINNQIQGWEQVEQAVADVKSTLGEAAAPGLSDIATTVADIVDSLKPLAGPLGKQVSSFFSGIAILMEAIAAVAAPFIGVLDAIENAEAPGWIKALASGSFGGLIGIGGALAQELEQVKSSGRNASDGLGEFKAEVDRLPASVETAEEKIKSFYDQVNNSQSVVSSIKGLATAWYDMEADLTPGTALTAFSQLSDVIEMVVMDGIGSLELLRLQAQAAGQVGFATPEQVNAVMAALGAIEGALTPIAEEAERFRGKLENDVAGGLNTTQGAAEAATTSVANYVSVLNQIPASVTTDVILNYLTFGMIPGGGGGTSVPRSGITPSVDAQTTPSVRAAEAAAAAAAAAAAVKKQGSLHDQLEESRTSAPGNAQNTLPDLLANIRDVLGLGGAGAKGGGGKGGGDSLAATIEQIRALMDAVNMAILIGLRGGVAVGMSGNAIPSIGGTFVSAQGGALQLQVQNVIIKGVWDFADPAAKRTILEELESLLASLKADAS